MTFIFIVLAFTANAATDLTPDYKQKLIPVESPLVLTYSFGPRPGDKIHLNVVNYPNQASDLFFVHVHKNETTAKHAGEEAVRKNGGTLMYLDHRGGRELVVRLDGITYVMDPNRIFTAKGLRDRTRPAPTPEHLARLQDFVEWIKRNIRTGLAQRTRPTAIALHNNTDDDHGSPVLSILTEQELIGVDNLMVNANPNWDIDNFYIVTEQMTFNELAGAFNPNISLRLERPRDFGYMANWMIEENVDYINIESETGDTAGNRMMIEELQSRISARTVSAIALHHSKVWNY